MTDKITDAVECITDGGHSFIIALGRFNRQFSAMVFDDTIDDSEDRVGCPIPIWQARKGEYAFWVPTSMEDDSEFKAIMAKKVPSNEVLLGVIAGTYSLLRYKENIARVEESHKSRKVNISTI